MGVPEQASERPAAGRDDEAQGRIPFLLRIGVTGHRTLAEDDKELLAAVNDAIELAISSCGYPKQELPDTPLRLTVVSALAEGADRIVARAVLDRKSKGGSSLVCVLPVTERELPLYCADFASDKSRKDFEELRGRAWRQVEPPAGLVPADATQEQRDAGYLWAGQEVARNSDVIIAIWDGKPPGGTGGTADLIRWLRERDTDDPENRRPQPGPDEPVIEETGPLRIMVHVGADRKPYAYPDDAAPFDAAADAAKKRLRNDLAGLRDFNHKPYPRARWGQWVDGTKDNLAPRNYPPGSRLNRILEQIALPLTRADQEAMAAQRYFIWSSYALFGFTALATILAALQAIVLTGTWELSLVELALIIASVVIVAAETRWKNNNKHWFAYRYLAERLRTAYYLLAVGRIPSTDFDVGGTRQEPTLNEWVRRAFSAVLSEGDVRKKKIPEDPETLSELIRKHWIGGQLSYFERASKRAMRRHLRVKGLLYGVLGATIVAVLLHSLRIWSFHSGETEALIMCAIGLPAAAAALSNVRSLREFSRHAFRYSRMAIVMRWYLEKFGEESSVEDLGLLAEKAGNLLTAETRDWLVEISSHSLEIHG